MEKFSDSCLRIWEVLQKYTEEAEKLALEVMSLLLAGSGILGKALNSTSQRFLIHKVRWLVPPPMGYYEYEV